jgi:hypothetical protein
MATRIFTQTADQQLHEELTRLAGDARAATTDLVACLAEFDRRRLFLELGFSSIYAYCAARLHLTEGAAYRRIEAARASVRFPVVLEMLRDGRLSLATAALIGPKLTPGNAEHWLRESAFKSKRGVEVMLAHFHPKPVVPSVIRKLPESNPLVVPRVSADSPAATANAPAPARAQAVTPASRRPIVAPLSDIHFKLQVTIGVAARERLAQIQALMRHRLPNGDPAAIVEYALDVLHADLLKQKAAQVAKPRDGREPCEAKGRSIPAAVKRVVWRRDQGRCAFVAADGRRCGSEHGVEFHHVQPYAHGGSATVDNIALRCRAHNVYQARLDGLGWQPEGTDEALPSSAPS